MNELNQQNIVLQMDKLIATIYDVFSSYSIDEVKGVCTGCCLSKESIEEILNVPLRELS